MSLQAYLFGSKELQNLARLVWLEGWQGSVRELSTLSGLSYSTTYETLQRMENFDLVKSSLKGRKRVYVSSLEEEKNQVLRQLLNFQSEEPKKHFQSLTELGAPLVGEKPEVTQKVLEELLCQRVKDSKENATLLRVLPLVLLKNQNKLNPHLLLAYANKLGVKQEMGFLLELTNYLANSPPFKKWSKLFKDRRWQKDSFYFLRDHSAGPNKKALVKNRTPSLAKKWFLKLNMDLDSEMSFLKKHFQFIDE